MLLKTFQISDFQSIRDSNPVEVGDVTCMVGKNEARKTSLLKALYRLNPIMKGEDRFDVTDDYPRSHVTEYEQAIRGGTGAHAVVTAATFEVEQDELRPIEEHFGSGVMPEAAVTLTRGYENKTHFTLKADEQIAGDTLLARANLGAELKQENLTRKSLKELAAVLEQRAARQQAKFNEAYHSRKCDRRSRRKNESCGGGATFTRDLCRQSSSI
jgi:predicted ATP-dependent endonuclease of OLD family